MTDDRPPPVGGPITDRELELGRLLVEGRLPDDRPRRRRTGPR